MRAKGPKEIANTDKTPVASDKKLVMIGKPECEVVRDGTRIWVFPYRPESYSSS